MDTMCSKSQRSVQTLFLFFILSLSLVFTNVYSADIDGAKLFKQNCAVCHSLGKNKITGPGLEGVFTRVPQPSEEWLLKWIKNNQKVIKGGDAYANKVYEENGKAQMTVFEDLSEEQIKAIITYFKSPPVESVGRPMSPDKEIAVQEHGVDPLLVLLGLIIFLVIIISVLRGIKKSLKNVINQKKGLQEQPDLGVWNETKEWMGAHKRFVALCVILLLAVGSKISWDWMMGLGVYQGYKPEQPIKFSHKIHAGDNAINCVYCHSGAEKGKTAGVPSANVCMNCHKGISKGAETGEAEIKKIYEAVGWNSEKQKYDKPQKPIKWNRVHTLPDFVYFNHSQHVVAGKQECKTCHGPIETMTVAEQFSPLTMRWCVDCHRQTEVKMEGNPYYEELHKKLAEKYKGQKITVDKMGGIECAKCHY